MKKYILACVFIVVAMLCIAEGAGKSSKKTYKIGDEGEGGGIVFYVSKEGFKVYDGKGGSVVCHYLEMSKDTLGESFWFYEYSNIGIKKTQLGYGKANTYKILNAKTSKRLTEESCAAYRCSKYSTPSTKAGEWWLPSKDELNLMYKNQGDAVLETSTCMNETYRGWYWSSSESDQYNACCKNFYDGDHHNEQKYNEIEGSMYSVRAVRAF